MFNWLLKADKKQKSVKNHLLHVKIVALHVTNAKQLHCVMPVILGEILFVQIVRVKFQSNSIKDTVLYPLHLSVLVLDTF